MIKPANTCKPCNPVEIKKIEPYVADEMQKEQVKYSVICTNKKIDPREIPKDKDNMHVCRVAEVWDHVMKTADDNNRVVPNNGIVKASKACSPCKGHVKPVHTVGISMNQ